jgi:hypothetical protein
MKKFTREEFLNKSTKGEWIDGVEDLGATTSLYVVNLGNDEFLVYDEDSDEYGIENKNEFYDWYFKDYLENPDYSENKLEVHPLEDFKEIWLDMYDEGDEPDDYLEITKKLGFSDNSKMKNDEDKTLDLLLENFEWFEDYNPASEFIWFNEEDGLGSVTLSFLKQFLLDNSDYPDKECKKIREIVKSNKIEENIPTIEKFLSNLNGGVQGNAILVPNTPEGRKDLYNRLMESFDYDEEFEKRTAEELNYRTNNAKGYDSRQKEICDSFSKRYNK